MEGIDALAVHGAVAFKRGASDAEVAEQIVNATAVVRQVVAEHTVADFHSVAFVRIQTATAHAVRGVLGGNIAFKGNIFGNKMVPPPQPHAAALAIGARCFEHGVAIADGDVAQGELKIRLALPIAFATAQHAHFALTIQGNQSAAVNHSGRGEKNFFLQRNHMVGTAAVEGDVTASRSGLRQCRTCATLWRTVAHHRSVCGQG